MKQALSLILTLTLICIISGAVLAFVHAATAERIATAQQERTMEAVREVLPPHDTILEPSLLDTGASPIRCYIAEQDGDYAGAAIEVGTSAGYGGQIRLMVGLDAQAQTTGLVILAHKETPGLGAKIEDAAFRTNLIGRSAAETDWRVQKDGGEIQGITAATISSRAVTEAVDQAISAYLTSRKANPATAAP